MIECPMKIIEMRLFMQEMDVRCGIKHLSVQQTQPTRMETLAFEEGPTRQERDRHGAIVFRNISNSNTKITLIECLCVMHCAEHSAYVPFISRMKFTLAPVFCRCIRSCHFWSVDSSFCVYPLQISESLVCWPFIPSRNIHVPSLS